VVKTNAAFRAVALGTVVLAVGLAACSRGPAAPGGPPGAGGPVEVGAAAVALRTVILGNEYPAQIEALSSVEIRPQVSGLIAQQVYREGAPVARGAVLFRIDARSFQVALDQARAGVAQAEAAVARATQDIARLEPLVAADAASRQELDNARNAQLSARAALLSAQAGARKAELDLSYATVRAPEAGIAAKSEVRAGALVVANQTLLTTVYSRDPMAVSLSIGEREMLALRQRAAAAPAGQKPTARLQLADGSTHPQPATLDFVNAAVDPRTGTVLVRLRVPNPAGQLSPGQFARVLLSDPVATSALLVPQKAVLETLGVRSVMVVGADGTPVPRPVTLGQRVGDEWIVLQGLAAGEVVMVDGFARLRPGVTVKPLLGGPAAAASGASAPRN
jgi:membrane fusion protein (multidrug efflux system)